MFAHLVTSRKVITVISGCQTFAKNRFSVKGGITALLRLTQFLLLPTLILFSYLNKVEPKKDRFITKRRKHERKARKIACFRDENIFYKIQRNHN
jgi:hypothetical protein